MSRAKLVIVGSSLILFLASCSIFGEGDPVDPKQGIVGTWQSDSNPNVIMIYNSDGTGQYKNSDELLDIAFKYNFIDENTVKAEFENGNSIEYDVRTTTRYLWMEDQESGTSRLHKME